LTTPPAHRTLGEVNAKLITDDNVQMSGPLGIQYITPKFILEAGVQLPILQDLASPRRETDFTVVLRLRIQF